MVRHTVQAIVRTSLGRSTDEDKRNRKSRSAVPFPVRDRSTIVCSGCVSALTTEYNTWKYCTSIPILGTIVVVITSTVRSRRTRRPGVTDVTDPTSGGQGNNHARI